MSRSHYLPLLDVATKGDAITNAAAGNGADDEDDDDEPLQVPEAFIERELLLEVMQKRLYRMKQCRSVPISVLMYFFYIAVLVVHVHIPTLFDVENSLVTTFVTGPSFVDAIASPAQWYHWAADNLVPVAFGSGGYIDAYNLMIGGVRLVTTRSKPAPCSGLPGSLSELYAQPCYPETSSASSYSSAPYGNATAAAEYGVASAFSPVAAQDGSDVPEFELFINTQSSPEEAALSIYGLAAAGWLDASTRDVKIQVTLLNGEVAAFGRVEWVAAFTRGSRVQTTYSVVSVPAAPYSPASSEWYLYIIDIVIVAYWGYLLWGTIRRLAKAFKIAPKHGGLCSRLSSCLWSYWRLLDVLTCASLFAVFVCWVAFVAKVDSIRSSIDDTATISPAAFSQGPSSLQWQVAEAGERLSTLKILASVTLVFFTLRLFKYTAFQSRLAVLGETFSRACSDMLHHSFLFAFLLVMFAVFGHFVFGSQGRDWADLWGCLTTVFRFSQYDVDLPAMQQQAPFWASLYYITFMVVVTNLLLWMLLGVLLDHYSEVRYASHNAPSAWEELGAYLATLPQNCGLRRIIVVGGGKYLTPAQRRKRAAADAAKAALAASSWWRRLLSSCSSCLCCGCCCNGFNGGGFGRVRLGSSSSTSSHPSSPIYKPLPGSAASAYGTAAMHGASAASADGAAGEPAVTSSGHLEVTSPHISVSDLPSLVSWADVVRVLKRHPGLSCPGCIVRPFPLARALGISPEIANLLIADAVVSHRVMAGLPLSEAEENAGLVPIAPVAAAEDPGSGSSSGGSVTGDYSAPAEPPLYYQYNATSTTASEPQQSQLPPALQRVPSNGSGGIGIGFGASSGNTAEGSPLLLSAAAPPALSPATQAMALPSSSSSSSTSSSSSSSGAAAAVDTARSARALYGAWDSKHFPSLTAIAGSKQQQQQPAAIRTARADSGSSSSSPLMQPLSSLGSPGLGPAGVAKGGPATASPPSHPTAVSLQQMQLQPQVMLPGPALLPNGASAVAIAPSATTDASHGSVSIQLSLAPHPEPIPAPAPAAAPLSPSPAPKPPLPKPSPSTLASMSMSSRAAVEAAQTRDDEEDNDAAAGLPSSYLSSSGGLAYFAAPSEAATAAAELVIAGYGGASTAQGGLLASSSAAAVSAAGERTGYGFFSGRSVARMASSRLQSKRLLLQYQQQAAAAAAAASAHTSAAPLEAVGEGGGAGNDEDEDDDDDDGVAEIAASVNELRSQMATLLQMMTQQQQQQQQASKGSSSGKAE